MVSKGQVEQLQRAIGGRLEALLVAFLPGPNCTADVGPRVAELLRERQRPPTAAPQVGMHRHRDTKRSTIDVSAARTAASSTERKRVPVTRIASVRAYTPPVTTERVSDAHRVR